MVIKSWSIFHPLFNRILYTEKRKWEHVRLDRVFRLCELQIYECNTEATAPEQDARWLEGVCGFGKTTVIALVTHTVLCLQQFLFLK